MTRSVFFDVDGVIILSIFRRDPARRRPWDRHLLDDLGVSPESLVPFFGPQFSDIIEGRTSIVRALDAFLPTIGYRGSSMDFLAYWFERDSSLNLQLMDLIKRLRGTGHARLFIATNQEPIRAYHLWGAVGLRHYFEDMFYAARFGVGKKDPAFYAKVDSLIGPQSEPPLFFDDSPSVVRVAQAAGWEAVLFADFPDCANHPWIASHTTR